LLNNLLFVLFPFLENKNAQAHTPNAEVKLKTHTSYLRHEKLFLFWKTVTPFGVFLVSKIHFYFSQAPNRPKNHEKMQQTVTVILMRKQHIL